MARNFVKTSKQRISTTLPAISDEITLVCSFKHSSLPGANYPNRQTFITRETGPTINYFLYATNTSINLDWTSQSNTYHFISITHAPDTTQFHTIALSHKWGQISSTLAYIDGLSATISSVPTNLTQTASMTSQVFGGRPAAGDVEYFDGDLANIAIYDKCLTADQLKALSKNFFASKIQRSNLKFFAPLIRDLIDLIGNYSLTNTNTSVATHPRIYA